MNNSTVNLRTGWVVACALALTLVASACGGGDDIQSSAAGNETEASGDAGQSVDTEAADTTTDAAADPTTSTATLPADDAATADDDPASEADNVADGNSDNDAADGATDETTPDETDSTEPESDLDAAAAAADFEIIATMAALGITPDSEAGMCIDENKDIILNGNEPGDALYVASKCAPAEVAAAVASSQGLGELTTEEAECVMTEALTYMAALPEDEARAAFAQDSIPAEYVTAIIPIAVEKCGVDAEDFAEEFAN